MGKLATIRNIMIKVYGDDHLPPHCHFIGPDIQALVEISTLAVIAGSLPSSAQDAMEWAVANKHLIVAEWNRSNLRFPIA